MLEIKEASYCYWLWERKINMYTMYFKEYPLHKNPHGTARHYLLHTQGKEGMVAHAEEDMLSCVCVLRVCEECRVEATERFDVRTAHCLSTSKSKWKR